MERAVKLTVCAERKEFEMKKLRKYSYVLLWLFLILTVGILWLVKGHQKTVDAGKKEVQVSAEESGRVNEESSFPEMSESESSSEQESEPAMKSKTEEGAGNVDMRGLWIPFMALTTEEKTEQNFKENFKNIVKQAKETGIDTLFVHIRPYCDALYPSEYYPWSHILSGEQGKNPGYDPLEFMVEYAHENAMKIHAWINPLRIKTAESDFMFSAENPYEQLRKDHPYYFMEHNGAIYLNPAYTHIRNLIADGAAEIAEKYNVDGIHFDDYFYPEDAEAVDAMAYEQYVQNVRTPLFLSEWRTVNINTMIALVYERVKKANPAAEFGISPSGNIEKNLKISADVKIWCAVPGYIDYICPQLYYSYDNAALGFLEALDSWNALSKHENLKVYGGLALYKSGSDADEGTWLMADNNLKRQAEDVENSGMNGVILYSSEYLKKEETKKEMENLEIWLKK